MRVGQSGFVRTASDLTYAGEIGNKLTDFIASGQGLFLPSAKLRPQKKIIMFTNRERVYRSLAREEGDPTK